MRHRCRRTTEPARQTLSVRMRTTVEQLPRQFEQTYGDIGAYLAELDEEPDGAPFAAYYNLDMNDLDVEIGIPVRRALPPRGLIAGGMIPGGRAATLLHTGPYSEMEPSYQALMRWMEDHEMQASGIAYEYYLDDPADTPPHQLRTRIVFPLVESNFSNPAAKT